MDDRPPPDALEKGIRFGCGFLFGGTVLFFTLARYFLDIVGPIWITGGLGALICGLICGLLAIRYGDDFYHRILAFLRWW